VRGVHLYVYRVFPETIALVAEVDSGPRGLFRVENLLPATYLIEFADGPCQHSSAAEKRLSERPVSTHEERRAETARLLASHPNRVDLEPGVAATIDLFCPGVVNVRCAVECPETMPVKGAWLKLRRLNVQGDPDPGSKPWEPTWGELDRTGALPWARMSEGRYLPSLTARGGGTRVQFDEFDLRGRSPVRVPLRVGTLLARVRVLDADGNPFTQPESLTAIRGSGSSYRVRQAAGRRLDSGLYELPYLLPGEYTVEAAVWGARAHTTGVRVAPDEEPPLAVVSMPPMGGLRVRFVDVDGNPVRCWRMRMKPIAPTASSDWEELSTMPSPAVWDLDRLQVGRWIVVGTTATCESTEPVEVEIRKDEVTEVDVVAPR